MSAFKFALGIICGCAFGLLSVGSGWKWMQSDTEKGLIFCTARVDRLITGFAIIEQPAPDCKNAVPMELLFGYTFAPGKISLKHGEPLTCRLVQHNSWYFRWDKGLYNDKSYTYDDCKAGRGA